MWVSLAGIYAVLSFTVSQRTREIGIRLALGGQAGRVVATVVHRPVAQIGIGVLLGAGLTVYLVHAVNRGISASGAAWIVAYVALMIGACMLASIVPARRALRIEPSEALKADG